MSDFYKMDPGAWDFGTASLTLEQEAAYLRIVNAIHKHKSALPDNDRILAGLFRTSTRKARALLSELIEAKKVRIEDGLIVNDRAISDLVHRGFVSISRAESGAKGGRTRAINAAKVLKNKDQAQANASSREEKRREEKKEEAKASSKKARASRLPADWFLPVEWGEWALAQGLSRDRIKIESDKFRDYWHSRAGPTASKLDWLATWRNWIRSALERTPSLKAIPGGRHDQSSNNRPTSEGPGDGFDPALKQIARLAGLGQAQGYGRA